MFYSHLSFPGGSAGKESACNVVQSLGWEDHMEKGLATQSRLENSSLEWTIGHGVAKSQRRLSDFHSLSSVQFSHSVVSNSLWSHRLQHARLPCPSPTPGAYSNSCPSSQWYHPTFSSSSVVPFSSHIQSFPASGSFPMSQIFVSGDQSIGVSASASVLPMNIQDWSLLGCTSWISLQSKGLSRVFSNTTVQKYQFFNAQLSL